MRRQMGAKRGGVGRSNSSASRRPICELLERRDLLSVGLAGTQTIGVWEMTIAQEVLSRTEARFNVVGSMDHASRPVTIDWGDGSAAFQGRLTDRAVAFSSHTFQPGAFTVTVTCDGDFTQYTYRSGSIVVGLHGGNDALFVQGNNSSDRLTIAQTGAGMLQVSMTRPSLERLVPLADITEVYGSMLAGSDIVTVQSNLALPTFFSMGDGNDTFTGGAGIDFVMGGAGNDSISGNAAGDLIEGGTGNDWIWAGAGDDRVDGGAGNDAIYGGLGGDWLFGCDGNDKLYGNSGDDMLEGGAADDKIYGHDGNDLLYGSAGDDRLEGANGDDWLFGEQGYDDLHGGVGNDVGIGGTELDRVYGDAGNNILAGGYELLLNIRRRDAIGSILTDWAADGQIPSELSDANLKVWNDSAVDRVYGGAGRNLFYADRGDRITGRFVPGSDVKVMTTLPTSADVATIAYTTTSGIVNPTGSVGRTTVLLGRWSADTDKIINEQLLMRKTMDFGARPRAFQVLNVPDELAINDFWTDYNRPFMQQAVARRDIFMAATVPSHGGGYGSEFAYLTINGYVYNPVSHQFVRS